MINVPYFELWVSMDFFLRFDENMPILLKANLLDLE